MASLTLALALAATALDGVLCGASLDQSIKQLPARHHMGAVAFSTYSRAADLGNGIVWYATLGIGAALVTIAAAATGLIAGIPFAQSLPLLVAAILVHPALAGNHPGSTRQLQPAQSGERRGGAGARVRPLRALANAAGAARRSPSPRCSGRSSVIPRP